MLPVRPMLPLQLLRPSTVDSSPPGSDKKPAVAFAFADAPVDATDTESSPLEPPPYSALAVAPRLSPPGGRSPADEQDLGWRADPEVMRLRSLTLPPQQQPVPVIQVVDQSSAPSSGVGSLARSSATMVMKGPAAGQLAEQLAAKPKRERKASGPLPGWLQQGPTGTVDTPPAAGRAAARAILEQEQQQATQVAMQQVAPQPEPPSALQQPDWLRGYEEKAAGDGASAGTAAAERPPPVKTKRERKEEPAADTVPAPEPTGRRLPRKKPEAEPSMGERKSSFTTIDVDDSPKYPAEGGDLETGGPPPSSQPPAARPGRRRPTAISRRIDL